jgi:putative component of membrane protein insertase Oxa1/YidC/SpoIIIJ protein YidD
VVAVTLAVWVTAAPAAVAADDEPPRLWQPSEAVAFLLETPKAAASPDRDADPAAPWEGGLGDGVTRALFGTYHTVFSSQDLPVCAFSPSCSRFSQRAVGRCGLLEGALLSLDRLLRDHPLAAAFYPVDAGGKLLQDDPARYCLTAPR